jgi:hypothetical protein
VDPRAPARDPHTPLLSPAMTHALSRIDRRALAAGLFGYRER